MQQAIRHVSCSVIKCISLALFMFSLSLTAYAAGNKPDNIEKIIIFRHGEKPKVDLGMLTCKGLNRSLALPNYLLTTFPHPSYLFAPTFNVHSKRGQTNGKYFSHMRPFSTIEPTAIRLDMPVNVSVKYDATNKLVDILLEKKYHSSTVYIAWEHKNAVKLVQGLLNHFGSNAIAPKWRGNDYSTVFIFKINWNHSPEKIKFKISKEKLPALSSRCS